jgi:uncharacterized protein YciI
MPSHYFLKLHPCRPTFALDMTDAERAIMGRHVAYWRAHMAQGKVIAFGPVLDPAGPYGIGIVAAESNDEIRTFIAQDPASTINRYDFYPMRAVLPG